MKEYKLCTRCNKVQHWTEFGIRKDGYLEGNCKSCRKDKINIWRHEHPDRFNENCKRWRDKNRDIYNAISSKYRSKHSDKIRQYIREHPDKMRAKVHNRNAMKMKAEGKFDSGDIARMLKTQRAKCYYCGKDISKSYHVDHVVPLSRGGANYPDNLVLACPHCNESKGAKLPHEWAKGGRLL